MNSTQTVYTWVPDGEPLTDAPRTLPACRVWGDIVLRSVADSLDPAPAPPVAIRSTALFAHSTPAPPPWLAGAGGARTVHEVEIDPTMAAVASAALADDLVGARAWGQLTEWLVDRGHVRDEITEDVPALEFPTAAMVVERGPDVVASTRPELLADIVSYFGPAGTAYLGTWRPFDGLVVEPSDEIVVPRTAVIDIR